MNKYRIAFIIDKVEFRYFEINELVTSFWLIKEFNLRGWDVFITTIDKLSLKNNVPEAVLFKTKLFNKNGHEDMTYEKQPLNFSLNDFDMIIFRPDPPVDMDYIFSTYILDYVDTTRTILINSPSGIRKANEKLYINNFQGFIPENITTSNPSLIKSFLEKHGEIVVKPLNKCFGKGVFYIQNGDKNLNTILDMATNSGNTVVMVQKYLENVKNGDKRVIIIGGEVFEECIIKVSGDGDFKFNTHKDEFFKKGHLSCQEREICENISPKLLNDGLYLVGLDIIDGNIIEINVTSPCFFIKEINSMFNTRLEVKIVDMLENLLNKKH